MPEPCDPPTATDPAVVEHVRFLLESVERNLAYLDLDACPTDQSREQFHLRVTALHIRSALQFLRGEIVLDPFFNG